MYFSAIHDAMVLFRSPLDVPKVTPMMSLPNVRTSSAAPAQSNALFIVRSVSRSSTSGLSSARAALYLVGGREKLTGGKEMSATFGGLSSKATRRGTAAPVCSPRGWELRRIQRQREKTKRFQYAMMPWLAAVGPLLWAGHQAFVWAQALPQ